MEQPTSSYPKVFRRLKSTASRPSYTKYQYTCVRSAEGTTQSEDQMPPQRAQPAQGGPNTITSGRIRLKDLCPSPGW